jgi:hypothetical protein
MILTEKRLFGACPRGVFWGGICGSPYFALASDARRPSQAQRRVSSAPGWSRSHLFGQHCQLRPLRTREVTALEVESQINSRNSRRI